MTLAESLVECLGPGGVVPGVLRSPGPAFEVVLRGPVRDPRRTPCRAVLPRVAPAGHVGPVPAIAGYAHRPAVPPRVRVLAAAGPSRIGPQSDGNPSGGRLVAEREPVTGEPAFIHHEHHAHPNVHRLGDLAHARSGDKGNRANIGLVAHDPACYAWLQEHLTAHRRRILPQSGNRPGGAVRSAEVHALSFVIEDALAGGASGSLRIDSQGKALGVALLELRLMGRRPQGHPRNDRRPPLVQRTDHGSVAVLTLNRPERRNAYPGA